MARYAVRDTVEELPDHVKRVNRFISRTRRMRIARIRGLSTPGLPKIPYQNPLALSDRSNVAVMETTMASSNAKFNMAVFAT